VPVIGRIVEDRLLLDVRTLADDDDVAAAAAAARAALVAPEPPAGERGASS
jgi:hypothetical protein